MINANELKIGDKVSPAYNTNEVWKVVEFDSNYGPKYDRHGVRMVRFIKTRNDWAVAPKALFCKEDGEIENWNHA